MRFNRTHVCDVIEGKAKCEQLFGTAASKTWMKPNIIKTQREKLSYYLIIITPPYCKDNLSLTPNVEMDRFF